MKIRRLIQLAAAVIPSTLCAQRSIEYDISFPNAAQHEVRIVMTVKGVVADQPVEARMSRSSPGRYAASSFGKNVYDVSATDLRGRSLAISRPDTHGWTVRKHDGAVRFSYTVWGDRIDGSYLSIDHSHAHMNMPATFMYVAGMNTAPIKLTIHPLPGWKIATQLAPTRDSLVFTAPNFQWFMDSPIEVGPVTTRTWTRTSNGKTSTWRIALHHLGTEAQVDSFVVMGQRVVDEAVAMWGEPAGYDLGNYTFIMDYLPWAGGDGMEHRNSTVITSSQSTLADSAHRVKALSTFSHEFFHSWNMERLRSREIEPFEFGRENMSDALWFGEGFTNYYGPLIIRRAGFSSNEDFMGSMGGEIVGTIQSPARNHGSPVDMSRLAPFFDGGTASDPTNRQNIFISYYTWGSVVAIGLDLTLREKYGKSLDDYMRQLWKNYGSHQSAAFAPEKPYTVANLREELGSFTGDPAFARSFFSRYVEGREVPDFATLLEPAGYRLVVDSVENPYIGASMDDDTTRVFINWSQEGGTMFAAGIASGDLVYSVDGKTVNSADSLSAIISRHKVGDVVQIDVEQRQVRRTIPITIRGRREMKVASYESLGLPVTPTIMEFRKSWLGSKR
ncbi:MAG TPA: PDZ domain-containing protein [Gemmatimonadaceae bacterium]|nr:PDZ domain-containing protein [Gemmatimonadaceae bacterium]